MGCGSSTPSDDDGAAYRAGEVTVYDSADAAAGGGTNDGGRADVAQKIAEIEASVGRFDKALAEIKENGGHPLPGSELAKHAAEEATNAVGALFTIASNLQTQMDDLILRDIYNASKEAVDELRQAHAEASRLLLAARNLFQACKLEIPATALAMAKPKAYAKLKVANSLDGTMQQVLGALVLEAEAKTKRPASDGGGGGGGGGGDDGGMAAAAASTAITLPSGEVRLDVWDHGKIAEKEAAKRVEAVAGKRGRGYFLISTRPKGFKGRGGGVGELWLSISVGGVNHFPITTDPKTKMLLVPKDPDFPLEEVNAYDGATTLHELVAALSKPDRGDDETGDWNSYNQSKHPVPSPESNIGGTVENPKQFASLMTIYAAARTAISGPLVRAIVKDLSEYDNAAAKHTALAGPAVMARLAAAATPEASASMELTADQLAEMTFDANAPPPTSLHFIVYSQRQAADVSIEVYHIACDILDAVVGGGGGEGAAAKGAYCIPGGVKGDRRILFKSLFKYGGVFSNCRDLSRLTICVLNLAAGAILAEAIHKHPLLLVIRCKNRFAASANTSDSGGYRDFQMLCIYKRGSRHYYVEIQINLVEMVAIKAGEGGKEVAAATTGGKKSKKKATDHDEMVGGHDAFNTARVIDAFSKRSLEYSGDPSDALRKMIAAGSLLRVVLDRATITNAQVKQLVEAMASDQCRVKDLSMLECKGITTIPEGLMVHIGSPQRESNPNVLDLSGWTDLRALPNSAWKSTHLKTLILAACDKLETLPETGVAGLVNLEELNLRYCEKLKQLPQSIAKLTKLKTLDLNSCENLETLPETGVAGLVNLEVLDMMHCKKLKQLPQSIAKLTKLKTLELRYCENLETLPETGVAGLVNLEVLNLNYCRKIKQLPQSIAKLTKLKTLNLEHCENLETLPETGVAGLVNLEVLNLKYCENLETLPETGVAGLVSLKVLNLERCSKLKQLPHSIAKLTKLKKLDLKYCDNLTEPLPALSHLLSGLEIYVYVSDVAKAWEKRGFTSLANHATTMKMLTDGTLHTYTDTLLTLTGFDIETLPDSIGKLAHLKMLNVSYYNDLETLPETGVAGLVNLEVLNLRSCKKLKQLPQSIAKLTKLKTLALKYCENLETLPETGVAGLVNLEVLTLGNCKKLKQLPQSIAKLTKLKTLDLNSCENLETLPETGVAGLVNLEVLNLKYCKKLKQLPQSIAKLTKLKTLKLRSCYNLETLPETGVAGLVNLEVLRLDYCEKLKQLPHSIAKLTKLKTLNLYNCENLETLPETGVAGLVNLEVLTLGNCEKLKQLPHSIAKLAKLKTLKLSNCKTLAEPLPDLSHLLSGLKIEQVFYASNAAKAWEKRGFTSLAK
eukprot:gene13061-biopygen23079